MRKWPWLYKAMPPLSLFSPHPFQSHARFILPRCSNPCCLKGLSLTPSGGSADTSRLPICFLLLYFEMSWVTLSNNISSTIDHPVAKMQYSLIAFQLELELLVYLILRAWTMRESLHSYQIKGPHTRCVTHATSHPSWERICG